MATLKRVKKKIRKEKATIGTLLIVLLTLLSAFGIAGQSFGGERRSENGEPIGSYEGQNFYKKDDYHYFTFIEGERWSFRGNPLIAKDIEVSPHRSFLLGAFRGIDQAVILIDPNADEKIVASSTDIGRLMGVMRIPTIYAFTEESRDHPDIPVMGVEDATPEKMVFSFNAPSNQTLISINPESPNAVRIEAESFKELDAAAAKISLIVFGVF